MTVSQRLARRLRFAADRIDPTSGPRLMTAVSGFTFEEGLGVVFRDDHRGCPVWYMAQDYDRAHDEAGLPADDSIGHLWVNAARTLGWWRNLPPDYRQEWTP